MKIRKHSKMPMDEKLSNIRKIEVEMFDLIERIHRENRKSFRDILNKRISELQIQYVIFKLN